MRSVRISTTARQQLHDLLEQGRVHYSPATLQAKYQLVRDVALDYLTVFPEAHRQEPERGLRLFAVPKTPFVIAYDFDAIEVRVHLVFHRKENRRTARHDTIEW